MTASVRTPREEIVAREYRRQTRQARIQAQIDAEIARSGRVGALDVLVLRRSGLVARFIAYGKPVVSALLFQERGKGVAGFADRHDGWLRFTAYEGWSETLLILERYSPPLPGEMFEVARQRRCET